MENFKKVVSIIFGVLLIVLGCYLGFNVLAELNESGSIYKSEYNSQNNVPDEEKTPENGYFAGIDISLYRYLQNELLGGEDRPTNKDAAVNNEDGNKGQNEEDNNSSDTVSVDGSFKVHYIDIGQGDATLIECDGEYMLIDTGYFQYATQLQKYLQDQGCSELKAFVVTHCDSDHMGGADVIVEKFPIETMYMTEYNRPDLKGYEFLHKEMERNYVVAVQPKPMDSFMLGSAKVTFLAPDKPYYNEDGTFDVNNCSICLRVDYGSTSFTFFGDTESLEEEDLLASGRDLSCDVYKVIHHGSGGSSHNDFLDALGAKYGVVSVGADNEYGHPHDNLLKRLTEHNMEIYRTDLQGTIIVVSDGHEINFSTEK